MAEAMVEHDYPLQALLYAVALHRYLRWRHARLPAGRPSRRRGLPVRPGDDRARTWPMSGDRLPRRVRLGGPPALVGRAQRLLDGRDAGGARRHEPGRRGPDGRPAVPDRWASLARSSRPGCSAVRGAARRHAVVRLQPGVDRTAVVLALALAARATRLGHVCLDLTRLDEQIVAGRTTRAGRGTLAVARPSTWWVRALGRRRSGGRTRRCPAPGRACSGPWCGRRRLYLQRYWYVRGRGRRRADRPGPGRRAGPVTPPSRSKPP